MVRTRVESFDKDSKRGSHHLAPPLTLASVARQGIGHKHAADNMWSEVQAMKRFAGADPINGWPPQQPYYEPPPQQQVVHTHTNGSRNGNHGNHGNHGRRHNR